MVSAEFENLKKGYKYYCLFQTVDDMAEYIEDNYCSYISLISVCPNEQEIYDDSNGCLWR